MGETIESRPALIPEDGNKAQRKVFAQFSNFAVGHALETQQTLTDLETGVSPFKGNEQIAGSIEGVLTATNNGKTLNYDPATETALFDTENHPEYFEAAKQMQKMTEINSTSEEREKQRRKVAIVGLGIFAKRAAQYSEQHQKGSKSA